MGNCAWCLGTDRKQNMVLIDLGYKKGSKQPKKMVEVDFFSTIDASFNSLMEDLPQEMFNSMYQRVDPAMAKNTSISLYKLYSKQKFKIMPQKTLQVLPHDSNSMGKDFMTIISKVDHPYALKAFEMYDIDSSGYLVTEGLNGEDVYKHIWPSAAKFTEADAAKIGFKLLYTLNYLHRRSIAHGNISLDTLALVQPVMGKEMIPKVFDLTHTFKLKENDYAYLKKPINSFSAPEVLRGHYSLKSDVWSAAYIIYVLITGNSPFAPQRNESSSDESNIVPKTDIDFREGVWDGLSENAKTFFQDIFVYYPAKRLNAQNSLHHEFFLPYRPEPSIKQMNEIKSSLKAYKRKNGFEQMIMYLICFRVLSEDYRNSLTEVFVSLDYTMDGVLSRKDLQQHFTEAEADQIIANLSFSKNNYIEFSEFLVGTLANEQNLDVLIRKAFSEIDKKQDEQIDCDEFELTYEIFCRGKLGKSAREVYEMYFEDTEAIVPFDKFYDEMMSE